MPYFLQVCRQVLISIPWATEAVDRYITMSDSLHSPRQHITYKICMVVCNCLNVSAPTYQQEISNSVSADEHWLQLCSVDHGDLVMPRSNTDRFGGAGFLRLGQSSGTSYHCTFGKCPIIQNSLLEHWQLFHFQTAPTSSSEDNIRRRAISKILTLTLTL